MHAARELAQLGDGDLQLRDGSGEDALDIRVDTAAEPALGRAQVERERDEPLLGAVVDVPLDPAPLLVPRGDDAPARLLHLHELRAHLRVQARVLEREPSRRRGGLEELRLVVERAVVDDHRDPLAAVRDLRDRPRRTRLGELDRRACRVDVPVPLGKPEEELEARVAEVTGKRVADPLRRRVVELEDELADVRPRQSSPQQTDEHRDRQQDLTRHLPPVQAGREELRQAGERQRRLGQRSQPGDAGGQEERGEDAAHAHGGARELPDHERDEDRGEDAVAAEHERPVELMGDARLCMHEHEALRAGRDVAETAPVVDEERRERQHRRKRVRGRDERALEPVGDPAGRVRERHMPEERDVELAQRIPEREHERVVGVLPRSDQDGEPVRDQQRAEPVDGAAGPGDQAGCDRAPADRDRRQRPDHALIQVVPEDAEGDDAEQEPGRRNRDLGALHGAPARSSASAVPESSSLGMNPAARLRRMRVPKSEGSLLETSTTCDGIGCELLGDVEPARVRERDVEEDDVRLQARDDVERSGAVCRLADHDVSVELEQPSGGAPERLGVIDDDDG